MSLEMYSSILGEKSLIQAMNVNINMGDHAMKLQTGLEGTEIKKKSQGERACCKDN